MKVVIQSNAKGWGGNEKWLMLVAEGLASRGHEVLVSCRPEGLVAARAQAAALRITHERPGADADFPKAIGFATMLRRERPDALLLSAFKRAFWGGWAAHKARIPRVVERLGIEQDLPNKWKYERAFRKYIDALIVNSEAIKERWLRSAPWFDASEVHVIYNAVSRAEGPSTIRAELGIPADTPLIAAAGTLEQRKGFDLLLDAFARLNNKTAHLLIAGKGPDELALRRAAAQLNIATRVHWLGFRNDLPKLLLGVDLFALTSRREGMANVLLEAMTAGCLIVATDVSGVRPALGARDGRAEAGWIVAVDDAHSLALALDAALDVAANVQKVESMRAETRFRAEQWFSLPRMIGEVEAVLAHKSR
jgi:glycosyltransferase involved in cell wall biosynthesis